MQLNGKNRIHGKTRLDRMFRNPILWMFMILLVTVGLYLFRSLIQLPKTPQPQSKTVMKNMRPSKPQAVQSKTSPKTAPMAAQSEGSKPEAESQRAAKFSLAMEKKRSLTPKADFMAPKWSRDGLDILATKGKYNGLYLISRDGSDIRRISDASGIGYNAHWSPDGNYVVVEEEDGPLYYDRSGEEVDADLVPPQAGPPVYAKDGVLYLQAGVTRSEGDEIVMADEDKYFEPIVSPDESKIAYVGLESGIIIKDLQTQEDVFIGQGTDICWTPDGDGIIFNYTQDDGERIIDGDIYFASADGNGMENLTNTPGVIERRPNLSGDGLQLTYEADGRIFSVDVVGR